MIGKTLGHYQITSQLGKGGMGEVYQAKDQKLGRDVAIKVLPDEFAKDADRVARFQREAKVLASLNHPNIAVIHGLEEFGGTNFLVLELIEGETLAESIKAGPIPVEEALKLALQIAEALGAAHEKGVIHRDLKPANIKVTPEGKVKVLDFGLAKAYSGEQGESNLSASPTLSHLATQQGIILGTAAYMSPEQARGKNVDKRTDIWAFGCLVYEMLTGQAAFQGEDVTEILAAVVKGGANLDLLPANIHPRVREVIIRCLQKDLNRRYQDIRDTRYEIEQALADPGGLSPHPITTVGPQRKLSTILPWAAAALVFGLIIAGTAVWFLKPSPSSESRQIIRVSYDLPNDAAGGSAISHNGRQFVYATPRGIYLHSLDELEPRLVPGTDGNSKQPFFSPDSKWIGYLSTADNRLKKIAITGGGSVDLCEINQVLSGPIWNADNTIVYSEPAGRGIVRVSSNGGTPEVLVQRKGLYTYPHLLPDGKSVLFTDGTSRIICVQSLGSEKKRELFKGIGAQYLATGHIVYASGNGPYDLMAVPFDLDTLKPTGGPVPILSGISGAVISDSGTLLYLPASTQDAPDIRRTPVWVDQNGKEELISGAPAKVTQPFRLSPDGKRVAFGIGGLRGDVWIWDLAREAVTRLTFDGGEWPLWTLDGRRIVYFVRRPPNCDVNVKAADGTGDIEKLGTFQSVPGPDAWSRDGKNLILEEFPIADISIMSMEGDHQRRSLISENSMATQPRISPDGRWIAYVSGAWPRPEIFVRPFPNVNAGKWQVSTGGGLGPLWAPDGRTIFYRNGDAVCKVEIETDPTFEAKKPKVLFRADFYYSRLGQAAQPLWDMSSDGKRFMMIKEVRPTERAAPEAPRRLNLVVNWFEELKQRVPVK
jgi:eukaryotic-like serine/threonine-protein kinase